MIKRRIFTLIIFTSLVLTSVANACPGTNLPNPCTPSSVLKSLPWNVILEARVNGSDFMSSNNIVEYNSYPGIGQVFYIPSVSDPDVPNQTLYRLAIGYPMDHMDSLDPNEGSSLGYRAEGPLGNPYTAIPSSVPGLSPIHRFFNGSDQLTAFSTYSYPGYTDYGSLGVYGFMRYLSNPSALQPYTAGTITEKSDLIAGGAVASWQWNGIEFIDTFDYGRYMQSTMFFTDNPENVGSQDSNIIYNPTEAGDQWDPDPNYSNVPGVNDRHGSPTVAAEVGTNGSGYHLTRAIPAEYSDAAQTQSNHTQVVLYNTTQIGKDLYLNWGNLSQVALYVTHFILPVNLPLHDAEVPSAYLSERFNNFYVYDAGTDQVTPSLSPTSNTCADAHQDMEVRWAPSYQNGPLPGSNAYGGIIIADGPSSTANAMGAYAVLPNNGLVFGPGFVLDNFLSCGGPASKWAVRTGSVTLAQGDNTFHTFIVTGTFQQVKNTMHTLYELAVN